MLHSTQFAVAIWEQRFDDAVALVQRVGREQIDTSRRYDNHLAFYAWAQCTTPARAESVKTLFDILMATGSHTHVNIPTRLGTTALQQAILNESRHGIDILLDQPSINIKHSDL